MDSVWKSIWGWGDKKPCYRASLPEKMSAMAFTGDPCAGTLSGHDLKASWNNMSTQMPEREFKLKEQLSSTDFARETMSALPPISEVLNLCKTKSKSSY